MPDRDGCTCYDKVSTQGCSEWSCPYHGAENRRKTEALRKACPIHQHCETCGAPIGLGGNSTPGRCDHCDRELGHG